MKVFISYSRHDDGAVRSMVSDLQRARVQVWLDDDLVAVTRGGRRSLSRSVGARYSFSRCRIILCTPSRARPNWVTPRQLGLPILPVQIGEISSYRAHPIFSRQLIDYRNPTSAGFELMGALHEQAAHRGDLPDPLPEGPPIPYEYLQRLGESIHDAAVLDTAGAGANALRAAQCAARRGRFNRPG